MTRNRNWGIVLSYCNTFLNMFCGLFMSSFLLRQLGETNYGVYQTMSSFANYLVLLEFGTGTVMSRNLSACRVRNGSSLDVQKNISTVWSVTAGLSALIVLVSIAFYAAIPAIYAKSLTAAQIVDGRQMFLCIVVFLVASFCSQTLNGITLAYEHYTFTSAISIVKIVVRTALLVLVILQVKLAQVITLVDALLNTAIAVFTYLYCKKSFRIKINFRNFDKAILAASLPLCLAMFLQTIINQSNSVVGKFVLGVMEGPEDVTLYSVGLYVFGIFSSLSTIPVAMYVPQVTKDVLSGLEGKALTKTLIQPCRLIVLVSGSVLFGFFACGRSFVSLVYGEEYLLSWLMAIILMAPGFLSMSNAVILNVLDVKNKRLVRSYILILTTALNVVMTIYGIRWFGIVAAAAATGISTLLQVIIMNIYYHRWIGIRIPYLFAGIYRGILLYQLLGAAAGYLVNRWVAGEFLSLLAAGMTYVVIAFGGFILFGMSETEAQAMQKLLRRLKNKENCHVTFQE